MSPSIMLTPPASIPQRCCSSSGLRPVLNTMDLVKIREDVSRPNFIARWRGPFASPASPSLPPPRVPALFWGERSVFLVKPCNGKPEPSAGGADPASLRVQISRCPCGAGFAHIHGLADGGLQDPAGSRVTPRARGWLPSSGCWRRVPSRRRGETEAAAEHLLHLPKPHLISQASHSLRNPGRLGRPGVTQGPLPVLSTAARG